MCLLSNLRYHQSRQLCEITNERKYLPPEKSVDLHLSSPQTPPLHFKKTRPFPKAITIGRYRVGVVSRIPNAVVANNNGTPHTHSLSATVAAVVVASASQHVQH